MRKTSRKRSKRKVLDKGQRLSRPGAVRRVGIKEVLIGARSRLREVVMSSGIQVLMAMLEEDREELCGPRYQPQEGREYYRYGYDESPAVLGGRKVQVLKPRVREVDGGEVELPTWRDISEEDPLGERAVEQMLVGVSTRSYERSLEPLPREMETLGVSRSSVSRRFVARTEKEVKGYLNRSLDGLDLPVVMVDGTILGEHVLVTVLGIDATGKKHVLGVREGSTESSGVCSELLKEMIERGLTVERARLFVIDGGKGIRKAIRTVFGMWALIQRCQEHKLRNVLEHLPKHKHAWIRSAIRSAWRSETHTKASKKLRKLAKQLDTDHPGAASSLREGMSETLTLIELGVRGSLLSSLYSTNPIENLQGLLKRTTRNVKRWRSGSMALRWAVTGLMEAEKRFRRIRGYREMPQLEVALEAQVGEKMAA